MSDPRTIRTIRTGRPVKRVATPLPFTVDHQAGAQPCFACGVRQAAHAELGCKRWRPQP